MIYAIGAVVVFVVTLIITAIIDPTSLDYDNTFSELIKMALFWPLTLAYWMVYLIVILRKKGCE